MLWVPPVTVRLSKTYAEHINEWLIEIGAGVKPALISDDVLKDFGQVAAATLKNQIVKAGRPIEPRTNKKLYFSEIGGGCIRKTWYKHNMPHHGKVLMPHERIKFMYGDQIEALVLALAQASGLNVHSLQKEVSVELKDGWELRGKIDCMIDDVVVDVKSTSTRSFAKFKDNTLEHDDPFGYTWQLGGYAAGLGAKQAEFLAFDKQLGHMVSTPVSTIPSREGLVAYANGLIDIVQDDEPGPATRLGLVPEGKSGNMKLCATCSYCAHNDVCWRDANGGEGLRTYLYSKGPVFLVHVAEEPRVLRLK